MKKRKKKISKTEKKLRGQLKYKRSVIAKISKSITEKMKEFKNDFNSVIDNKGTKLKKFINEKGNEITKKNSELREITEKLQRRFKFKPVKGAKEPKEYDEDKGEDKVLLGFAWDRQEIESQLFDFGDYATINKKKIKTDLDAILDLLNNLYSQMDSTTVLVGYTDAKQGILLRLEREEDNEQIR